MHGAMMPWRRVRVSLMISECRYKFTMSMDTQIRACRHMGSSSLVGVLGRAVGVGRSALVSRLDVGSSGERRSLVRSFHKRRSTSFAWRS